MDISGRNSDDAPLGKAPWLTQTDVGSDLAGTAIRRWRDALAARFVAKNVSQPGALMFVTNRPDPVVTVRRSD
jgi:hypothetical protein